MQEPGSQQCEVRNEMLLFLLLLLSFCLWASPHAQDHDPTGQPHPSQFWGGLVTDPAEPHDWVLGLLCAMTRTKHMTRRWLGAGWLPPQEQ